MNYDLIIKNGRIIPAKVLDKATFEDPHHFPEGMPYILINGELVVEKS